ncbi:MAG: hypothetical protein LBJ38_01550 [Oscillospiraceae bacterium]|jgi:hypothetical protein|nr:hypothetical protein [Oscillospiraceae bacterium]
MRKTVIKKIAMLWVMLLATGLFFGSVRAEPNVFVIPVRHLPNGSAVAILYGAQPLCRGATLDDIDKWSGLVTLIPGKPANFLLAVADLIAVVDYKGASDFFFNHGVQIGSQALVAADGAGLRELRNCWTDQPICELPERNKSKKLEGSGWALFQFPFGATQCYQVLPGDKAPNRVLFRFSAPLPYGGEVKDYRIELFAALPVT